MELRNYPMYDLSKLINFKDNNLIMLGCKFTTKNKITITIDRYYKDNGYDYYSDNGFNIHDIVNLIIKSYYISFDNDEASFDNLVLTHFYYDEENSIIYPNTDS